MVDPDPVAWTSEQAFEQEVENFRTNDPANITALKTRTWMRNLYATMIVPFRDFGTLLRGGNNFIRFTAGSRMISAQVSGARGAWSSSGAYSEGDTVRHENVVYRRITGPLDVTPQSTYQYAVDIVRSDPPDQDTDYWEVWSRDGTGGGGTVAYNQPVITEFDIPGWNYRNNLPGVELGGRQDIRQTTSHSANVTGNYTLQRDIGDGNGFQDLTGVTGDIVPTVRDNAVTLPAMETVASSSWSFRLKGRTKGKPGGESDFFSTPIVVTTRAALAQHEYLYGFGAASREDLTWANYDITAYDQRADVSSESYHVRVDLGAVQQNHYVVLLIPSNREPDTISDVLGPLRIGTDITRVRNARTIGGQAFTAYYTRHTDSQLGDYYWNIVRN